MKKIYILIAFCVLALIQIFIPAQMVLSQETVLEKGKPYKFITRPIDPNDPFRGKYITLRYEISSFKTLDTTWQRGDDVYVYIKDSLGFAKLDTISKQKIVRDTDYVIGKAKWLNRKNNWNKNPTRLNFNLPFNRFYMNENKAKPAEDAVRFRRNDSTIKSVYGLVHIKDGTSVLKDVIINSISIKDYVEQNKP
ncbi:MAG: hypothetical protein EVB11_09125 [Winogradskyella sp.]|nr:MAG: hypothetical protein EVB11_09125 [Winogradskyella sp.]